MHMISRKKWVCGEYCITLIRVERDLALGESIGQTPAFAGASRRRSRYNRIATGQHARLQLLRRCGRGGCGKPEGNVMRGSAHKNPADRRFRAPCQAGFCCQRCGASAGAQGHRGAQADGRPRVVAWAYSGESMAPQVVCTGGGFSSEERPCLHRCHCVSSPRCSASGDGCRGGDLRGRRSEGR